jgi:hypothetical protein
MQYGSEYGRVYSYHERHTRQSKWRLLTPAGSLGVSFDAILAKVVDARCNSSKGHDRERIFYTAGATTLGLTRIV